MIRAILLAWLVSVATSVTASDRVYTVTVDAPASAVYDSVYKGLEAARFFVVFEPDIGSNLKSFARRWGDDYNRNGLSSLRAMVFCNAWYANQVSNKDLDMLGLCPMHLTVYEKSGSTTVVFNRPSFVASQSPALPVLKELEQEVIAAIESSLPKK